jgi:hypothetical protein
MTRASLLAFTLVVACGGKSPPAQLAPLPDDQPATTAAQPAPAEPAEPQEPEPPPEPPKPLPPIEIGIPATQVDVKLVTKGKGKRAPLRYAPTPGAKQTVEVAVDFSSKQTLGGQSREDVVPTVVLTGEVETKAVDKDGKVEYVLTVTGSDARDTPGMQVPIDKFKRALASLDGLVIKGTLNPDGTAAGDLALRIEQPDELSAGALDLMRMTYPSLPVLPKEPVGVGAKWRATSTSRLMGQFEVTETTEYQLVSNKNGVATIKSTSKVTGKEQQLDGAKITNIDGTGSREATLTAGGLYPTSAKSSLETGFTATEGTNSMTFSIKVGGAIAAK